MELMCCSGESLSDLRFEARISRANLANWKERDHDGKSVGRTLLLACALGRRSGTCLVSQSASMRQKALDVLRCEVCAFGQYLTFAPYELLVCEI